MKIYIFNWAPTVLLLKRFLTVACYTEMIIYFLYLFSVYCYIESNSTFIVPTSLLRQSLLDEVPSQCKYAPRDEITPTIIISSSIISIISNTMV